MHVGDMLAVGPKDATRQLLQELPKDMANEEKRKEKKNEKSVFLKKKSKKWKTGKTEK